jgi:hypothetical protein
VQITSPALTSGGMNFNQDFAHPEPSDAPVTRLVPEDAFGRARDIVLMGGTGI